MPQEQPSIQDIFEVARRIDSVEARELYLNQVCADSFTLRKQVQDLLESYSDDDSFLESPPSDVMLSPTVAISEATGSSGSQIGPYKLLQEIGEGGMGVVYMAEQKKPVKRRVALKIIKPGMDTRQIIARFEAERQALAMMDHPNIAKVLDAGTTDTGRPYFVMELVNGNAITRYCDEHHLTPRERLDLFAQVCEAVQHAHQKGVIHRDIKPSNILVARYDEKVLPKIIDFGVAKATGQTLTDKTMYTEFGQVLGTLEYMSPEQSQRNQLDVDTRSDIYSLGVVLYELLVGETPFGRERIRHAALDEVLRIIREEEPAKPSQKLSTISTLPSVAANRNLDPNRLGILIRGDLDWIVMKSLEKDRGRRYDTANAFADDIRRYLADEPVAACPPSAGYRFGKLVRRNKLVALAGFAVAASLVLGLIGTGWQAMVANDQRDAAVDARASEARLRRTAENERDRAEEAEQKATAAAGREKEQRQAAERERERAAEQGILARKNLYAADMNLAQLAYEQSDMPRARSLLSRHVPLAGEPDWRSYEWYHLVGRCRREEMVVNGRGFASFSPDSKRVAVGNLGNLEIWNLDRGRIERTIEGAVEDAPVAFAPDGETVASVSNQEILVWDAQTGALVRRFGRLDRPAQFLEFTPDGRLVCIAGGDLDHKDIAAVIFVYDAKTGEERLKIEQNQGYARSYALSPDGRQLITHGTIGSGGRREDFLYDLGTGNALPASFASGSGVLAWSPDGRLIAKSTKDKEVVVCAIGDPMVLARMHVDRSGPEWMDFSPDGSMLAVGCFNSNVYVYDLATRQEVEVLQGHSQRVFFVKFSPDSKRIVSLSRDLTMRVWSITRSNPIAEVSRALARKPRSFEDNHSQFSVIGGNGNWFAGRFSEKTARVVDATNGDVLHEFEVEHRISSLSGQGDQIAVGHEQGLELWELTSGNHVASLETASPIISAVFSNDGRHVAVNRGHECALVCDGRSLSVLREIDLFDGKKLLDLRELSFSSCGRWLAALTVNRGEDIRELGKGFVHLWSTENWEKQWTRSVDYFAQDIGFSPDGLELAVGYGHSQVLYDGARVKAWSCEDGRALWEIPVGGRVCMAFDYCPDGKTLATANGLGVLAFWDRDTRELRLKLSQEKADDSSIYKARVVSLRFTPDGRSILTNDCYGEVELFTSASDPDVRGFERFAHRERLQEFQREARWAKVLDVIDPEGEHRADVDFTVRRANALAESGRKQEALAEYEKLVELSPGDASFWRALSCAHLASGNREGFEQICCEIQDRFRETNDLVNAIRALSALTISPVEGLKKRTLLRLAHLIDDKRVRKDDSSRLRGEANLRCGRFGPAVDLLLTAEKQSVGIPEYDSYVIRNRYLLAIALLKVGLREESEQWRILAEESRSAQERLSGGSGYRNSWEAEVVLDELAKELDELKWESQQDLQTGDAESDRSKDGNHWLVRAYVAKHDGDMDRFAELVHRAAEADNQSPLSWLLLAKCNVDQQDFVTASRNYLAAMKRDAERYEIEPEFDNITNCIKALKNSAVNRGTLDDLLAALAKLDTRNEAIHYQLAVWLMNQGRYHEALEEADRALRNGGAKYTSRHTVKAEIHVKLGNYDEAIAICDLAEMMQPSDSWWPSVRMIARERSGDVSGAIEDAIRAVKAKGPPAADDWEASELMRLCSLAREVDPATIPRFETLDELIDLDSIVERPKLWPPYVSLLRSCNKSEELQEFCKQLGVRVRRTNANEFFWKNRWKLRDLSMQLIEQGDLLTASEILRIIWEKVEGSDHSGRWLHLHDHAKLCHLTGQVESLPELSRIALEMVQESDLSTENRQAIAAQFCILPGPAETTTLWVDAVEAALRGLEDDELASANRLLGHALIWDGQYARAKKLLQPEITNGKPGRVYFPFAILEHRLGNQDKARELLQQADAWSEDYLQRGAFQWPHDQAAVRFWQRYVHDAIGSNE